MKCQNCGRELKNGARFCIACGAQHDHNGQLISGGSNVDYNKTMMASNMQGNSGGSVDYDKTMMTGNTGFQQYQGNQDQQNFEQYNYSNEGYEESANTSYEAPKKKISPILIICPLIIIGAIAFSLFGNKKPTSKNVKKVVATESVAKNQKVKETSSSDKKTDASKIIVKEENESTTHKAVKKEENKSTASTIEKKIEYPEGGYWDAEAEHFYVNGVMQKDKWIGDYYVGPDGKKLVSAWTNDNYYVDALGKKARNMWIEFSFIDQVSGLKKTGLYYVDEDGKKVTNKTIDGKYLDDTGSYFPNRDDDKSKKEDESESSATKETSKVEETTKQKETQKKAVTGTTAPVVTLPPVAAYSVTNSNNTLVGSIPANPVPAETSAQTVPSNVITVASNGKSIAYNIVESSIPNANITKFQDIVITDQNHSALALNVNKWNNGRSRSVLSSGEVMSGTNISITSEVKIERNDDKVFSLYEKITKFDGTRAYEIVRTGMTWDVNSGELLSIENIFASDKYADFSKKVLNKLKTNKNNIDSDKYQELTEGGEEELNEYYTWYMTKAGITIVFNKDRVDSNKVDGVSFSLSYSDSGDGVNKLLQSKYRYR